jgi:hypothetical protein
MDSLKTCKYCNGSFSLSTSLFANHIRWCEKNPNRNNWNKRTTSENILLLTRECKKCNNIFSVEYKEGVNPPSNKFCSRRCANSRGPRSDEFKNKIRLKLQKVSNTKCQHCSISISNKRNKFCSKECIREYKKINWDDYKRYRNECAFKFSLNHYPDEFNFDLIEKYGWYLPKNRGDNLNGVSRDHMISVKYGYENNIDPKIISHPANCMLLRHNDNVSKHKKCSLTIEQLLEKIQIWDTKYGA